MDTFKEEMKIPLMKWNKRQTKKLEEINKSLKENQEKFKQVKQTLQDSKTEMEAKQKT